MTDSRWPLSSRYLSVRQLNKSRPIEANDHTPRTTVRGRALISTMARRLAQGLPPAGNKILDRLDSIQERATGFEPATTSLGS
jgi:hypothetical protein